MITNKPDASFSASASVEANAVDHGGVVDNRRLSTFRCAKHQLSPAGTKDRVYHNVFARTYPTSGITVTTLTVSRRTTRADTKGGAALKIDLNEN